MNDTPWTTLPVGAPADIDDPRFDWPFWQFAAGAEVLKGCGLDYAGWTEDEVRCLGTYAIERYRSMKRRRGWFDLGPFDPNESVRDVVYLRLHTSKNPRLESDWGPCRLATVGPSGVDANGSPL